MRQTGMAWPCCEDGWRNNSEEVTGKQTTEKLSKEKPT